MNKKNIINKLIFMSLCVLLSATTAKAQVTIGENTPPMPFSILELITNQSQYRGLRLPQLNSYQVSVLKDSLNHPAFEQKDRANGLMVFNTDVGCTQIWETNEFWSVCGDPRPAQGTVGNCSDVRLRGVYISGVALNSSNYISIPIVVETPGTYEITVKTNPDNGYFFSSSGTFPNAGTFIINIPGTGTPATERTDYLDITFNGETNTTCRPANIVMPNTPDYRIIAVQAYTQPFPVNAEMNVPATDPSKYYAEVTLSVTRPGEWRLFTSTVNGYMFSGSGRIEQASGYNAAGSFPQTVQVLVPVVSGGKALNYTAGGLDQFTMVNDGSATYSTYPFTVKLAAVGFELNNCADITFSNLSPTQNVPLPTNPEPAINVPYHVISSGKTVLYATFAGVRFKSDTLDMQTDGIAVLKPVLPGQSPAQNGNVPILFESTEGGITVNCQKNIHVAESAAKFSTIVLAGYTNNGTYLVDPYNNTTTPCSVILSASASQAGHYSLSTNFNGVTYSASGTVNAGSNAITLLPTEDGTTINNGHKTFTLWYDKNGDGVNNTPGTDGSLTFTINFAYRTINILSLGIRDMDRPLVAGTTSASTILHNKENFGPSGTCGVNSIKIINGGNVAPTADEMRAYINNNNIDIVFYCGDTNTENTASIVADFVNNKHGVLIFANQTALYTEKMMKAIYGGNWSAPYRDSQHRFAVTAEGLQDTICKGPFGTVQYVADDCGNGTRIINALPSGAVKIADLTGYSSSIQDYTFMFKHEISSKGAVFYCGDWAWANGRETAYNWAYPAYSVGGVPLQMPTYLDESSRSAGPVQNAILYANVMAWAIDYAAKNVITNYQVH
ncbi:MAG: hypothetical protein LBR64_02745 [Dysgonamonadaceae bacterium]|jgi:hypothetical protein|nr:hypothetical protein [Dysgonamonadaceae bacterium]